MYVNSDPMRVNRPVESNTITIDQSGLGASAWVDQFGNLNRADIVQEGWSGGNFAQIHQVGDFQQGAIFQAGGSKSATIRQDGPVSDGNALFVNSATIRQGR